MKKQMIYLMLTALLLGTIVPSVFADAALTNERFNATGNYEIVAAGVGLEETDNEINVNVPGTVIQAYLYWIGYDDVSGDNTAVFEVSGTFTALTADFVFGPDVWKDWENNDHYVYGDDVTSLINTGANSFNITGIEMYRVYGVGVIIVYEDSSLPVSTVTILDGLDSFYFDFSDPRGPNSEVTAFEFDQVDTQRTAGLTMLVGGTEHENRPNEVWTETGSGEPLDDIINVGDPSGLTYPLCGCDGRSWDTYNKDVTVAVGDTWLGVQIESIPSQREPDATDNEGLGTSGVIAAVGLVLPLPEPRYDGKVTGGGQIPIGSGKKETATFGFNAMATPKAPGVKGELQYLDHTTGMLVHAHIVDTLEVWEELIGNKPWPLRYAEFSGPCTVNHEEGYSFLVLVEDNGEPGKSDYFSIKIFDGSSQLIYEAGSTIIKGNIQIHKP